MTQAGGPAAINGFLYQITHHLSWLAEVKLSGKLDGQEVENACLVLEPRNGGDARAEASGIYLVEQYKTRKNSTWSLSEIIESVLPDLRKSIPSYLPAKALYRFVTDGREGRLQELRALLKNINSVATPDDLDINNCQLFDRIVIATRSSPISPRADERVAVFHLLSRFDMKFGVDASTITAELERLFRRCGPDLGKERRVREELVGKLMEELSKGETRLDSRRINGLFESVDLNLERLKRLTILPEKMAEQVRRQMRVRYQAQRDVRSNIPQWPTEKPVLLIAGESGSGKTWQLARLLGSFKVSRQIPVLVNATRTVSARELLQRASNSLWQIGLGETSEKSLAGLSNFLGELLPDIAPRAIVAVDDVQDIDLARDIIQEDWFGLGMRLVLTVPWTLAQPLMQAYGDIIRVYRIGDFSVDELDALLKQCGRCWAELPPDLKKLLRKPILAGRFLELSYTSFQDAPHSEYEIFERYWQRITEKCLSGDSGIVIALADHFLQGEIYPLPRPRWCDIGLEDITRLAESGWLHYLEESGEVEFAHDRLLNWAVAKLLVMKFRSKQLSFDELRDFFVDKHDDKTRHIHWRLGYVLMDTLWMLAANDEYSEILGKLVVGLENNYEYGSYGKELYIELLPTLGQRAVPILLERLKKLDNDSDEDYQACLIGKAFIKLAQQEYTDLTETIEYLLYEPLRIRQKIALKILSVAPKPRYLDRLWQLCQQHAASWESQKTDSGEYRDYKDNYAALRASIELNPTWLCDRILNASPEKEPVDILGYLLHDLENQSAFEIWNVVKDALIGKTTANKPRGVLQCIGRFADHGKLDYVIGHLSCFKDFADRAAFSALVAIDPLAAIARLADIKSSVRNLFRNTWLPVLLYAQPDLTRQRILEIAKSSTNEYDLIETLFWERPDAIDEAMLRFILRKLEGELKKRFDDTVNSQNVHWLSHPLEFLGRISRSELLAIIQAEVGGELERLIVAVACNRPLINDRSHDYVVENVRRILLLMGSDGISELVKRELGSEHYLVRINGIKWAYTCANEDIIKKLSIIAFNPIKDDVIGMSDSSLSDEFLNAITVLSILGKDAALVDAIQRGGEIGVPIELAKKLAKIRAHYGPIAKYITRPALQTLQNPTSTENAVTTALIIAWLSYDPEFIPVVRAVLSAATPESQISKYACMALQELGDLSGEFVQLAQRLAYTAANCRAGLNALCYLGDEGLRLLGNWLKGRNAAQRTDLDVGIMRILYRHPETRELSIDIAAKSCLDSQVFLDSPYEIAAEAHNSTVRERILDMAFTVSSFVRWCFKCVLHSICNLDDPRKLIAVYIKTNHNIVHLLFLGKANGFSR